jgi:hypothetical protein
MTMMRLSSELGSLIVTRNKFLITHEQKILGAGLMTIASLELFIMQFGDMMHSKLMEILHNKRH